MNIRVLLWIGTILNAIVFVPATIMAINAVSLAQQSDGSAYTVGLVVLFFALPVFCIAVPFSAWRAHTKRGHDLHALLLLAAPLAYAAFLVVFLLTP